MLLLTQKHCSLEDDAWANCLLERFAAQSITDNNF